MNGDEAELDGMTERIPGGEAIEPGSAAADGLDPATAVTTEVTHREGAFGDNSSEDDSAPIP